MSWFETVRHNLRIASEIADSTAGTRDALLGLWLALDIVPSNLLDTYSAIPEAELVAEAAKMDFDSIFADVQDPGSKTAAVRALVRDLGIRLRALELHLHDDLSDGSRPSASHHYRVTFENFEAYLIMLPPRHRKPRDRQPFRLRGLVHSRLLPVELGAFKVELIAPLDPRGALRKRASTKLNLGAGLFDGMDFGLVEVEGGFAIEDPSAPNQLAVIQSHLAMAAESTCSGVVYPELTIGETVLGGMIKKIREGAWATSGLSIIVAGSRHVETADGRFNVATILDGYGDEITIHKKLFSFTYKGQTEAIDLGNVLNVVLLEDTLFAFGICLDFCNPRVPPPYLILDVDFILVPSCGEDATMRRHIERSTEVLRDMGSHSFVVQQYFSDEPEPDAPLGYVLSRSDPAIPSVEDVSTGSTWHTKSV